MESEALDISLPSSVAESLPARIIPSFVRLSQGKKKDSGVSRRAHNQERSAWGSKELILIRFFI